MTGERPRLLLLHGTLSSRVVWSRLRRELGDCAVVIAPDMPGYGRARWEGESFTLEGLAGALRPLIEAERPTHVVGHSMGGIVALELARHHSFERVGIIGLPVYESRPQALEFLNRRGRVVRSFLRSDRVSHVVCRGAAATYPAWQGLVKRRMPTYTRAILHSAFDHCESAHRAFETIVFAGLVDELAAGVELPVAALHGEADRAAPVAPLRRLAEARGWDLTVDGDANHQVVFQRPRYTANWIRERVLAPAKRPDVELPAAGS